MRAVFADDSLPMRERLRAWLRNCGQEVIGDARNARDAYELCQNLHPDLAIFDVLMPPGDGRTTAVRVKQEGLAKEVLVVTSNSQKAIVQELSGEGIHLLVKPLGEAQFAAMVNKIGASFSATQQSASDAGIPTVA